MILHRTIAGPWSFCVRSLCALCAAAAVLFSVQASALESKSSIRIRLVDGAILEVPYIWEEGDLIKFQSEKSGIIGLPKDQVVSMQEVLVAEEFDPEALLEASKEKKGPSANRIDALLRESPTGNATAISDPEKSLDALRLAMGGKEKPRQDKKRMIGSTYTILDSYAEMVESGTQGARLLLRYGLGSRENLEQYDFTVTLYDVDGKELLRTPCDIHMQELAKDELKRLDIRGRFYIVTASVKPDVRIRRYEISAKQR